MIGERAVPIIEYDDWAAMPKATPKQRDYLHDLLDDRGTTLEYALRAAVEEMVADLRERAKSMLEEADECEAKAREWDGKNASLETIDVVSASNCIDALKNMPRKDVAV